MIDREALQAMFNNILTKTDWAINGPMLWGYFFTNDARGPLEAAAELLRIKGYQLVGVYLNDMDDPSAPDRWCLHMEMVETHTVDSLLARNEQLSEFAARNGLASYDGMDVGPAHNPASTLQH